MYQMGFVIPIRILTVMFSIILLVFVFWIYKLQPITDLCTQNSDWLWNDGCLGFQELAYDSSLKSPEKILPVLTNFEYVDGAGPAIYTPCWYRIRYVNTNTGGYSDFSEWTTLPVMSGGSKLPCISSKCDTGESTCTYNQPTIGISSNDIAYTSDSPLKNGDLVFANLHRYTGTDQKPPADAQDEIVGYLNPGGWYDGVQYYEWADILNNPCQTGNCQTPKVCA